jgi:hypothetical protein
VIWPRGRGGFLPWALLVVASVASLAANVAVAQPTATGRVIAAWPPFAMIAAYELLMRQVRRSATTSGKAPLTNRSSPVRNVTTGTCSVRGSVLLSRARTVRCLAVAVKRSGAAGAFDADSEPGEPGLRLAGQRHPLATGEMTAPYAAEAVIRSGSVVGSSTPRISRDRRLGQDACRGALPAGPRPLA